MCGISGGIGESAPKRDLLDAQLASIEHRGPDDKGTFIDHQIGLGMCRLAIVEIAEGKQPASDATEKIHLVWNGEIYNYRELAGELEKSGVYSRNSSESEVLINLYLTYGIDFISKLNGMFAIAIHDARENTLHLVRDRMGKKPLWISHLPDGTIFFASEVRALMLARPDRTLRTDMISEVMQYGYINSPNSAFLEINQLPPASVLTWSNGNSKSKTYWEPNFKKKVEIGYEEALEVTKNLIEAAVSRRLISERPLGSFLSGGYDSTIVTAYMSKLMSEKVQSYSIGFENAQFNEAGHARKVAAYLGTDHHEEILKPDPNLIVERISKILDQPFADSSIVPTYLLSQFARENLVVALSGDGGDEIFGGYDRYLAAPLMQRINFTFPVLQLILKAIHRESIGKSRRFRRGSSQLRAFPTLSQRYFSIQTLTQNVDLNKVLSPDLRTNVISESFLSHFNGGSDLSELNQLVRSDLHYYLPGDILNKIDIASMANSLELRSPLLDVNVVEWGLSLPDTYKIKGLETKHILKDVARSLVPPQLIDRPKMGFGIPRASWLRNQMKDMLIENLTDSTATNRGWFVPSEVRKVIDSHLKGDDKDSILWPLLMIELWARTWLD
jgi:asparagine synthase (glutamine-hydrolysing)